MLQHGSPNTYQPISFFYSRKKRTSLQFTIGYRHLHVRVRQVDTLKKRLPPSNLHCLSKDNELEMDNTRETSKEEKK